MAHSYNIRGVQFGGVVRSLEGNFPFLFSTQKEDNYWDTRSARFAKLCTQFMATKSIVEHLCETSLSYGTGQVLCAAQAVEIYRCKLRLLQPHSFASCLQPAGSRILGKSVQVAGMFKVSPKTVRDIWNRRTWACTTRFLWAQEDDQTLSFSGLSAKLV